MIGDVPAPTPKPVRRCARCGQPSLVVVREWHHRFAGILTPRETLELECEACKARVVLHPWPTIRAERLLGVLLMPAVIPGLILLSNARAKERAWTENPVVEALPPREAHRGQPPRRCVCSASAACVAIVREGTWTLPLGTRHEYRCAACGERFAVHDLRGLVTMILFALAFFGAGALVVLHPPGAAVGAERGNQWFGVALLGFGSIATLAFVGRVRRRSTHPLA